MSCSPFSPIKLKLLSDFLKSPHVLDVGSGRLYYARWIKNHFPGTIVTALDMFDQDLEPEIVYVKTDLERGIPCEESVFETVIAFDVIEHIQNEQLFIDDLFRVLVVSGVLIGSVPHDADGFLPAYNLTFFHRSDVTHKRYYTVDFLTVALKKAGFTDVVVMPGGGISPHVISEFFPKFLRWAVKKIISLGYKIGFLSDGNLRSDLFFVAYKK